MTSRCAGAQLYQTGAASFNGTADIVGVPDPFAAESFMAVVKATWAVTFDDGVQAADCMKVTAQEKVSLCHKCAPALPALHTPAVHVGPHGRLGAELC